MKKVTVRVVVEMTELQAQRSHQKFIDSLVEWADLALKGKRAECVRASVLGLTSEPLRMTVKSKEYQIQKSAVRRAKRIMKAA